MTKACSQIAAYAAIPKDAETPAVTRIAPKD